MKISISILLIIVQMGVFAQDAREICPINIGKEIPEVNIKSVENKIIDLKNLCSTKPTVIVFYRGGWCPYCTRHLTALRELNNKIIDMGYQIIALSPDKVEDIPETVKNQNIGYQLFSDRKYEAMNAFGNSFKPTPKRMNSYTRVMKMLEKDILVPVPSIFIIKDGKVKYKYVNPDYTTRISSEMLMAAIKSLK